MESWLVPLMKYFHKSKVNSLHVAVECRRHFNNYFTFCFQIFSINSTLYMPYSRRDTIGVCMLGSKVMLCELVEIRFLTCSNTPVLQNACPCAVAIASYTEVIKITKNTTALHAKKFEMTKPSITFFHDAVWILASPESITIFSHDAVQILASPESIAGGALNCKTGELGPTFTGNIQITT